MKSDKIDLFYLSRSWKSWFIDSKFVKYMRHTSEGFQGKRQRKPILTKIKKKRKHYLLFRLFRVFIFYLNVQGTLGAHQKWTNVPKTHHMLVFDQVKSLFKINYRNYWFYVDWLNWEDFLLYRYRCQWYS